MELYHGSNVIVEHPRLFVTDRHLDFGPGFYVTSSVDQASRWARLVTKRRRQGTACVSVFDFDEAMASQLDTLVFESANLDWLRFVGSNRRGESGDTKSIDLVIGPVANDRTMPTLRLFFGGVLTAEETIKRLLPQKLDDQYAFRTPEALRLLTFKKAIEV